MRGGYQHNTLQVAPLERECRRRGADVRREQLVRRRGVYGFIDLVAQFDRWRLVIEVERTAQRVHWDLVKAAAAEADELWIVTPESRVAEAVRRKLRRLCIPVRGRGVFVFTQGQAMAELRRRFPFISGTYSNSEEAEKRKTSVRITTTPEL